VGFMVGVGVGVDVSGIGLGSWAGTVGAMVELGLLTNA